jgi:hypothetical protein
VTVGDVDLVGRAFPDDSASSTASMDAWELSVSTGRPGVLEVVAGAHARIGVSIDSDTSESTLPCVCDISSLRGT